MRKNYILAAIALTCMSFSSAAQATPSRTYEEWESHLACIMEEAEYGNYDLAEKHWLQAKLPAAFPKNYASGR